MLLCKLDEILNVVMLDCVCNVPKIFSVRHSVVWCCVWHVPRESLVLHEHWIELPDRKFIVPWHVDSFDFTQMKKSFLFLKNLLQKVFVDHSIRRHVQLQRLSKIVDEVFFAPKLRDELCG